MDYNIFNGRTDVNACGCTQGAVRTHVTESALKVDSVRKSPCRTGDSNLRQRRVGPMLYQLSYIPIMTMLAILYSAIEAYFFCVYFIRDSVLVEHRNRY